jgi:thiamine-phosphate pyrophosphorylase
MKGATSRQLYEAACEVAGAIRKYPGARLVVNDRLDVALAVGADAVHLGQADLTPEDVRRALTAAGRAIAYGVSTHDLAQARAAEAQGAAYIGFGPMFETGSKAGALPPRGLGQLAEVCRSVRIPVIAIGGIDREGARDAAAAGAAGVAVIAAVTGAPDMRGAVRALAAIFPGDP